MFPPPKFEPPLAWGIKRTPRQKIVALWRGIDLADQEKTLATQAKSAASLVPNVLNKLDLDQKRSDLEILKVWNHLLDPQIVAHAKPTGLAKGTLFVTVDSSVWLDELVRYRRREILQRLQHSFGRDLIQRISFRAG